MRILDGTYDFRSVFESLGVKFSGIAITEASDQVVHAFHFVRRETVADFKGSLEWDVANDFEE